MRHDSDHSDCVDTCRLSLLLRTAYFSMQRKCKQICTTSPQATVHEPVFFLALLLSISLSSLLVAEDWRVWRGPTLDNHTPAWATVLSHHVSKQTAS